jgi:hypothetical protein
MHGTVHIIFCSLGTHSFCYYVSTVKTMRILGQEPESESEPRTRMRFQFQDPEPEPEPEPRTRIWFRFRSPNTANNE